jgi:hypothetical protein
MLSLMSLTCSVSTSLLFTTLYTHSDITADRSRSQMYRSIFLSMLFPDGLSPRALRSQLPCSGKQYNHLSTRLPMPSRKVNSETIAAKGLIGLAKRAETCSQERSNHIAFFTLFADLQWIGLSLVTTRRPRWTTS